MAGNQEWWGGQFRKDVHCLLSSFHSVIEAMERPKEGVEVGGELLKNVWFADEQEIEAITDAGLWRLMESLNSTT